MIPANLVKAIEEALKYLDGKAKLFPGGQAQELAKALRKALTEAQQ